MNKLKLDRWILGEDEPEDRHAAFNRREQAYKSWCRNHGDAYDVWCERNARLTCPVCGKRHGTTWHIRHAGGEDEICLECYNWSAQVEYDHFGHYYFEGDGASK